MSNPCVERWLFLFCVGKVHTGTKPQFRSTTTVSTQRLSVVTAPHGRGRGAEKWWYLELGTRIRWALMSSDWRSKTGRSRRARLRSSRGRGRVLIVGKRAMTRRNIRPRPGIRARNWRAEVNRLRSRKFKGMLKRIFDFLAQNTITPRSLRLVWAFF